MVSSQNCLDSQVLEDILDVQTSLGDLDSRIAQFRNDRSQIRRRLVTGLDLDQSSDIKLLEVAYSEWLLDDIYLTFKHRTSKMTVQTSQISSETEYVAIKARKRGNDIDSHRIDQRLKSLKDTISPFVSNHLRSTSSLYVTGTLDKDKIAHDRLTVPTYHRRPVLAIRNVAGHLQGSREKWYFQDRYRSDREYAWKNFGTYFNSFLAGLRKKCRTVEISEKDGKPFVREVSAKIHVAVRSWEAHKSGWPHFHAILCFEGYPWEMFQNTNKKTGILTWRIEESQKIKDSWTHGFVDVLALTRGTLEKNIQNVLWYVSKNHSETDYRLVRTWPHKKRVTQSLLWYLGMRSFSASRSLLVSDCEPDADLIKRSSITQVNVDLKPAFLELHKWEFLGLVRRIDTELERDDWEKPYSEPPDWLDRVWNPWKSSFGSGWASSWLSGGSDS